MKTLVLMPLLLCGYLSNSQVLYSNARLHDTLMIGDPAPPLHIIKWLKGTPVSYFKKDSIYVIEFGFAACTPCRASIPRLSALAKRYAGKISIISIHIWENDINHPSDLSYVTKVKGFVQGIWDKIGYTVAVDVPEQTTANDWNGGAPKSYVVGPKGTILWIGFPDQLDTVISKIISNSFDPESTAAKDVERENYINTSLNAVWVNKDSGNYEKAIAIIDTLIERFPDRPWLFYHKYRVLVGYDSANRSANDLVKWLLHTKPKGFNMMYFLGYEILRSKYEDYDLAIAAFDWALTESSYSFFSASILEGKGIAYYKKGDLKKAIDLQSSAIKLIKPDNTEMKGVIKLLQKRLDYYLMQSDTKQHAVK